MGPTHLREAEGREGSHPFPAERGLGAARTARFGGPCASQLHDEDLTRPRHDAPVTHVCAVPGPPVTRLVRPSPRQPIQPNGKSYRLRRAVGSGQLRALPAEDSYDEHALLRPMPALQYRGGPALERPTAPAPRLHRSAAPTRWRAAVLPLWRLALSRADRSDRASLAQTGS